MGSITVLVIEKMEAEAALIHAALALHPEIRVVESAGEAVFAIAGASALRSPPRLRFPIVGIAEGLSVSEKRRALAAGVHEIHERPREWADFSALVGSIVARFTRTG